jgi:transcriptional regulator with XRE-family HTH domain
MIYKRFSLTLINYMTGEELKSIIANEGYKLADIAEALGMTPQNLNSRLKAKVIRKEFLNEIERIIKKDISSVYLQMANAENGSTAVAGNGNTINQETKQFIELLKKKDEQIDRLLTIIENISK